MPFIKINGKVYDYANYEDKVKPRWKEKMRAEYMDNKELTKEKLEDILKENSITPRWIIRAVTGHSKYEILTYDDEICWDRLRWLQRNLDDYKCTFRISSVRDKIKITIIKRKGK